MKAKEAKQILDKIPDDWEVELKIKDRHGNGINNDDDSPNASRPYHGPYGEAPSQFDR